MKLTVTLTSDEVTSIVKDFLPARIGLAGDPADARWIEIDDPEDVSLIPGRGVRVVCSARVRGVAPSGDVTLPHLYLMFVPQSVATPAGRAIHLKVRLEDVEGAEGLDRALVARLEDDLQEHGADLAWEFTRTLRGSFALPERLQRVRAVRLRASRGEVEVTETAITLTVWMGVSFAHASEAQPVASR